MRPKEGPSAVMKHVCDGCKYLCSDVLRIRSDSYDNVKAHYCLHKEVAKKFVLIDVMKIKAEYIGSTTDMPEWCPFNPEG